MYAQLNISTRSAINAAAFSVGLKRKLGASAIPAQAALAGTFLAGYTTRAVAAASFPDGTVVAYLLLAGDLVIYVLGTAIRQIKARCLRVVEQLHDLSSLSVKAASATILVPAGGSDDDILIGSTRHWHKAFWASLREKAPSKVVPSAVAAGLTIYFLVPAAPARLSASIALVAALVGVIAEALVASWDNGWKWEESK